MSAPIVMDRDDIINDIIKRLDKASDYYYNTGKKMMSDADFDAECEKLRRFGITYNTKTPPRSNKRVVSIEHSFENLLGTIDNKFQNIDDLFEWLDNITSTLGIGKDDTISMMVSEKYDGNSCAIEYENGKCKIAMTRGENGMGADLTDYFADEELKETLEGYVGIRYEVMMTYKNFDIVNKLKEESGDSSYVNPRSVVAGILGNSEGIKYKDYLTLVPLAFRIKDKSLTRLEELDYLDKYQKVKDIDFQATILEDTLDGIKNQISDIYNEYIDKRETMDYMIDGLVIEFMDQGYRDELGYFATGSPKFSAALKFPYMEKTTTVKDIVFELSPNGSGKITPSVIYDEVYFNGAKMTKTSLANYKRFRSLKLGKGSKILVQYRNDVLSYVEKLEDPENDNIIPIPFCSTCPVCGAPVAVNDNETFAYCTNPSCESKRVGKINAYVNSVGMKGIEYATLQKIYNEGLIRTPADLYRLRFKQLSQVKGLGEKSAENIIDIIMTNRPADFEVLAGLSITNLGRDTAKKILNEVNIDDLCDSEYIKSDKFRNVLSNINGIGEVMTNRIIDELTKNSALVYDILSNAKYTTTQKVKAAENQLTFVHTGDTDPRYFKDRNELRSYIERLGHKLTSSVSKKTDYLITENPNSGTVKNKKAKELCVKIITCEQLRDLLDY